MTQEQQPIDLMAAVARVQRAVVVPKAKYNAFGKFSYRSYEDIVAALKEPCAKEGLAFFMTDELVQIGDRYYVKSALCGAFAIDGQSDPDAMEEQPAPEEKQPPADGPFTAHCRSCGARYQFASMPQYMEFVANSPCCPRPDWQVE